MNTEYIDSLDEAAYISSLEQQNRELLAVLKQMAWLQAGDEIGTSDVKAIRDAIAKATA